VGAAPCLHPQPLWLRHQRGRSISYDLKAAGTAERLLPQAEEVKQRGNVTTITNQHMVRTTVSVFEFDLR